MAHGLVPGRRGRARGGPECAVGGREAVNDAGARAASSSGGAEPVMPAHLGTQTRSPEKIFPTLCAWLRAPPLELLTLSMQAREAPACAGEPSTGVAPAPRPSIRPFDARCLLPAQPSPQRRQGSPWPLYLHTAGVGIIQQNCRPQRPPRRPPHRHVPTRCRRRRRPCASTIYAAHKPYNDEQRRHVKAQARDSACQCMQAARVRCRGGRARAGARRQALASRLHNLAPVGWGHRGGSQPGSGAPARGASRPASRAATAGCRTASQCPAGATVVGRGGGGRRCCRTGLSSVPRPARPIAGPPNRALQHPHPEPPPSPPPARPAHRPCTSAWPARSGSGARCRWPRPPGSARWSPQSRGRPAAPSRSPPARAPPPARPGRRSLGGGWVGGWRAGEARWGEGSGLGSGGVLPCPQQQQQQQEPPGTRVASPASRMARPTRTAAASPPPPAASPSTLMRSSVLVMYSAVARPGRTPGMLAPCRFSCSDRSCGAGGAARVAPGGRAAGGAGGCDGAEAAARSPRDGSPCPAPRAPRHVAAPRPRPRAAQQQRLSPPPPPAARPRPLLPTLAHPPPQRPPTLGSSCRKVYR